MKKLSIVLIMDGNGFLRDAILSLLGQSEDTRAIAVEHSKSGLIKAAAAKPQLVLADPDVRDGDLAKEFAKRAPNARLIAIRMIATPTEILEFARSKINGFIPRFATFDDMVRLIRALAKGEELLPLNLTGSFFSFVLEDWEQVGTLNGDLRQRRAGSHPPSSMRMTAREREVTALVVEGQSNKEIAAALNISVDTVKTHVHHILSKLALRTRLELASHALRSASHISSPSKKPQ